MASFLYRVELEMRGMVHQTKFVGEYPLNESPDAVTIEKSVLVDVFDRVVGSKSWIQLLIREEEIRSRAD